MPLIPSGSKYGETRRSGRLPENCGPDWPEPGRKCPQSFPAPTSCCRNSCLPTLGERGVSVGVMDSRLQDNRKPLQKSDLPVGIVIINSCIPQFLIDFGKYSQESLLNGLIIVHRIVNPVDISVVLARYTQAPSSQVSLIFSLLTSSRSEKKLLCEQLSFE